MTCPLELLGELGNERHAFYRALGDRYLEERQDRCGAKPRVGNQSTLSCLSN